MYNDATPQVYLIGLELPSAIAVAEKVRDAIPEVRLVMNCSGGDLRVQLRRADKSNATIALIVENDASVVTLKFLRENTAEQSLSCADAIAKLREVL